jgi:hypothetical protein
MSRVSFGKKCPSNLTASSRYHHSFPLKSRIIPSIFPVERIASLTSSKSRAVVLFEMIEISK